MYTCVVCVCGVCIHVWGRLWLCVCVYMYGVCGCIYGVICGVVCACMYTCVVCVCGVCIHVWGRLWLCVCVYMYGVCGCIYGVIYVWCHCVCVCIHVWCVYMGCVYVICMWLCTHVQCTWCGVYMGGPPMGTSVLHRLPTLCSNPGQHSRDAALGGPHCIREEGSHFNKATEDKLDEPTDMRENCYLFNVISISRKTWLQCFEGFMGQGGSF